MILKIVIIKIIFTINGTEIHSFAWTSIEHILKPNVDLAY